MGSLRSNSFSRFERVPGFLGLVLRNDWLQCVSVKRVVGGALRTRKSGYGYPTGRAYMAEIGMLDLEKLFFLSLIASARLCVWIKSEIKKGTRLE